MLNFSELGRFYAQLAALDHAGFTYLKVFESLKKTEKDPDRLYKIQFMISHLTKNRPLSDGFKILKYVPAFDLPLIKAAEDSGRTVEIFKTLAKKYNEAAISEREIRSRLLQPYFTFVVALFVPSFPDFFLHRVSLTVYLKNSLGVLVVVTALFYGFYQAWMRSFYELKMAQTLFRILSFIPFLKALNQKVALEKFSTGLAMMLDSGMDLFESLRQASLCSGDPEIKAAIDQFVPMIKQGVDIAKVFQARSCFPQELVSSISLGADSGKLPEFLRRYSEQLRGEIDMRLKVLTKFIPMVIYFGVTIYVVSIIVSIYTGHLDDVIKAIGSD